MRRSVEVGIEGASVQSVVVGILRMVAAACKIEPREV